METQVVIVQTKCNRHFTMKLILLLTLTLQNAIYDISIRYARTRSGDMFIASTAVAMAEVVKLAVCIVLVYRIESTSLANLILILNNTIVKQPVDTLKVCIPSLVYLIQNNLQYLAASNLDVTTYQVTNQLKIFTTAVFSIVLLKRKLSAHQWIALVILIVGVLLVQVDGSTDKFEKTHSNQNRIVGIVSALIACVLSGFAGVYFEKMLKEAEISIWIRNIQLSFVSIPLGFIICFTIDLNKINSNGFYFGYDLYVTYLISLHAAGGIIVASVIKYADNILKGFVTSLAIILVCIISLYLFDGTISIFFFLGILFVICSIFLYNYTRKN